MTLKICALDSCEEGFEPKTYWQRFCCEQHKREFWKGITALGMQILNGDAMVITREQFEKLDAGK